MKLLRGRLGPANCGRAGLDRKANVVGPTTGRALALLGEQLALVHAAVESVAAALNAAIPEWSRFEAPELLLRSCEACLDLGSGDALAAVRSLQRAPVSGAAFVAAGFYYAGAKDERGVPAVRWRRAKTGPVFKA